MNKQTYLVLSEDIDKVLLFKFSHPVLVGWVRILLRYRVVEDVLLLDESIGDLLVLRLLVLEVPLLVDVVCDV